jgi:hypothetical protein
VVSGFQVNLLTGLAVHLAAGGLGATWNTSGLYSALQTGIVLGNVPQTPDRVITLTTYGVSDSPNLSDSILGVQVRTRWGGSDTRPVDDLDDAIFNLLHGRTALALTTGVTVVLCLRQSTTTLGQDANGRWMRSSNYYLTVHRPSTHRT